MPTHYEVLGIPRVASVAEIKRAYRQKGVGAPLPRLFLTILFAPATTPEAFGEGWRSEQGSIKGQVGEGGRSKQWHSPGDQLLAWCTVLGQKKFTPKSAENTIFDTLGQTFVKSAKNFRRKVPERKI